MTVITAVRDVENNSFVLGCDSMCSTTYHIKTKSVNKKIVFKKAGIASDSLNIAICVTGSYRLANLVNRLSFPTFQCDGTWRYIDLVLCEGLKEQLADEPWTSDKDHFWHLMVIMNDCIFQIPGETMEVMGEDRHYSAAGSGLELALGSLHTSNKLGVLPQEPAMLAMLATDFHHVYAKGPYYFWSMPIVGDVKRLTTLP